MREISDRFFRQIQEEKAAYPEQFDLIRDRWVYDINTRYVDFLTEAEREQLLATVSVAGEGIPA